jgi:hypothetical protein
MSLTTGRSNKVKGRKRQMARRPRSHEKINMETKRFGYFPKRFTWRGRRYDVQAVERSWTVSRRRLGNQVDRLCFRVRGVAVGERVAGAGRAVLEGTFDVYQDLNSNTWHMEKVVSRA